MVSSYCPGFSLPVCEIRPAKATLLVALWPMNESVPPLMRRCLPTIWVKLKVTVACSLSENENVVPIGVLLALRRACATAGGRGVSLGTDGAVVVGWVGGVVVASVVEVAARASVVNV